MASTAAAPDVVLPPADSDPTNKRDRESSPSPPTPECYADDPPPSEPPKKRAHPDPVAPAAPQPSPARPSPMSDWTASQDLLDSLEISLSTILRRPISFDSRHRGTFRAVLARSAREFWSLVDHVCEYLATAEWSDVRDDVRFVQSVINKAGALAAADDCPVGEFVFGALCGRFGEEEVVRVVGRQRRSSVMRTMVEQARAGNMGWEKVRSVFEILERRLRQVAGRVVKVGETHQRVLREWYGVSAVGFWSVMDQLSARLVNSDWATIKDDESFISAVLTKPRLRPARYDLPEREYSKLLIEKLMPNAAAAVAAQQQQQKLQSPATATATKNAAAPSAVVVAATPLEQFYSWALAERLMAFIEQRLSAQSGRSVKFDRMHRDILRSRFYHDPLGFWSVLDRVQEALVEYNWANVSNDAKFIQSFLSRFEPSDAPFSAFMASIIPVHPSVKPGMPPHTCHGSPPRVTPSAIASNHPPVYGTPGRTQSSPPAAPAQKGPLADWRMADVLVDVVEQDVSMRAGMPIKFDTKHRETFRKWFDQSPSTFAAIMDQVRDMMMAAEWRTVRDKDRFIQSLFKRPELVPKAHISAFMASTLSYLPTIVQQMQEQQQQPQQQQYIPRQPQVPSQAQQQYAYAMASAQRMQYLPQPSSVPPAVAPQQFQPQYVVPMYAQQAMPQVPQVMQPQYPPQAYMQPQVFAVPPNYGRPLQPAMPPQPFQQPQQLGWPASVAPQQPQQQQPQQPQQQQYVMYPNPPGNVYYR